jgi:hypothetical protein
MRFLVRCCAVASALAFTVSPSFGALITFDLTGSLLTAPSIVLADTTGFYSITAVSGGSGCCGFQMPDPGALVHQDANGLGVLGVADGDPTLDKFGYNDRIGFDLGTDTFTLVSVGVSNSAVPTLLRAFKDGLGDLGSDFGVNAGSGLNSYSLPAGFDVSQFTFEADSTGVKITTLTFETNAPLVPSPATAAIFAVALPSLIRRRRR